jgi:hypothetical protein
VGRLAVIPPNGVVPPDVKRGWETGGGGGVLLILLLFSEGKIILQSPPAAAAAKDYDAGGRGQWETNEEVGGITPEDLA